MRLFTLLPLPLLCLGCKDKAAGPTPPDEPHAADDTGEPVGGDGRCPVDFSYAASTSDPPDAVLVAGSFNGWEPDGLALALGSDGVWTGTARLDPGAYPYKIVERVHWSQDTHEAWVCDPANDLVHCEADYKEPWSTDWAHECGPGTSSVCNSLLVVPDCSVPTLQVRSVQTDRLAGTAQVEVDFGPNADGVAAAAGVATHNGQALDGAWTGDGFSVSLPDLAPGRHTLRFVATDAAGNRSQEAVVPFWIDAPDAPVVQAEDAWRRGAVYYAFVDRLANGDVAIDAPEGSSHAISEYAGGDFQGVTDLIDYLDDIGVTTIWLSNAQDNAEGAWDGQCASTFAGYHQYWPDAPLAVEEHFGGDAALRTLVDAAHDRQMRVVMDWVANHVHQDHPYYLEHGEDGWFTPYAHCEESVDGQLGFDRIPETCWFAPYLPDIDYSHPDALNQMIEDALWWATEYELDGFRVDAAKHMSHAVQTNLEAGIQQRLEHRAAGSDFEFWTVGETFDSYDRIREYMGETQLDGQFDFPLYYSINAAFAREEISLGDLQAAVATSDAAFDGALMSNFLGNHDVMRFSSYAAEGSVGACWGEGDIAQASLPSDDDVYARLRLAWVFLFTQPSVPLVYYGDEIGLPGYTDPDNRQPLWWATGDVSGGAVQSASDMGARVGPGSARVLDAVARLGRARRDHPAFWRGPTTEWWLSPAEYPTVWAYSRVDEATGDAVLVVINRSWETASLSNGLAWAGLPTGGAWTDVLSGASIAAAGDNLSFDVGARDARVWVAD